MLYGMDTFGLEHWFLEHGIFLVAARKLSLRKTSYQYEAVQELKMPKKTDFIGAECPKMYLSSH